VTETRNETAEGVKLFNVEGSIHRLVGEQIECYAADGWRECNGELPAVLNSGTPVSPERAMAIDSRLTEDELDAPPAEKALGE
jgi:hypothetical protein